MEVSDCFKIGYVQKTHGLKGEVTIALEPGAPDDFETITSIFAEVKGRLIPYFIEEISFKGDKAFVKFEDVNTSEEATTLKGTSLYLPKSTRPKSKRGEFYNDEVIGFTVNDATAGLLGKVSSVENEEVNPLLIVLQGEKEIAIPINAPFITSVNKSTKRIEVDLPEGLLEL
ncbi:16S rRNA processing protein RimM [Chryseotalea sanaruensis]|uniref:Ribosome maturation factor RimM n=1 Tax=Chryseotalea sanaruensis TaxID=2482724 RepID=A0A401UAP3_9BACT|nr:ribosome maturation factor RimM [Chryseotalea sanaruensis]GCC51955.1 16S rRNA processing protein RimM [Chryseotalea sanaruensis]